MSGDTTTSATDDSGIPFLTVKQPLPEYEVENLKTVVKLWIVDLFKLSPTSRKLYYKFNNLIVNRVDVFGVITEVKQLREHRFMYKVDDGTGSIQCIHSVERMQSDFEKLDEFLNFKTPEVSFNDTTTTLNSTIESNDYDDALLKFKDFMKSCLEKRKTEINYDVGDTIHANGVLYDFKEDRQFFILDIRKVTDLNEETDRIFEMDDIYRTEHCKIKGLNYVNEN